MAYKAQSLDEGAQQLEVLGLGDRVNAALALRKFTFLSRELCPASTCAVVCQTPVGHLVDQKSRLTNALPVCRSEKKGQQTSIRKGRSL